MIDQAEKLRRVWGPVTLNRELLGPQCAVDSPGAYEIRWLRGSPVRLTVKPVPDNERLGAELMRTLREPHPMHFFAH